MLSTSLFPTWRTKVAAVANGSGDARVLFVGDSTTRGAYSADYPANPTQSGWPALMSKMFPPHLPVSNASLSTPGTGDQDSRVTLGGGWKTSQIGAGFAHWCFSATAGGRLVFTPGDGLITIRLISTRKAVKAEV